MGDGQEKTESATAKRRMEARKRGTVVRSTDLIHSLCLVALLLGLPTIAGMLGSGAVQAFRNSMAHLPTAITPSEAKQYGMNALMPVLPGLGMLAGIVIGMSLVVNFAQVGFVFSTQAMTPSFGKINPLSGLKRFVSRNGLFDAGKAFLKTFLFGLVAFLCVRAAWPEIIGLGNARPSTAMAIVGEVARTMATRIALIWGAMAGLDYFFQKQSYERNLRMTKEEVKQEMREMEMAPEIKAARNMRRRKLMRQRLRDAVRQADVVITNPTHYAVALKYDPTKMYAPMVVAKGVDFLAAKIREEAAEASVPLVPNPPLARALYKQCEIGDPVPRELFQAVAEVLAHVYRILKKLPPSK